MSKKGTVAFASVVAALIFASWIERATPKAVKRDSVSAEKTMRDFSLTGRQHFGVPPSNLRMSFSLFKSEWDKMMEKWREQQGEECGQIGEICATRASVVDPYMNIPTPWNIVRPCCEGGFFERKPRCRPVSKPGRNRVRQRCFGPEEKVWEEAPAVGITWQKGVLFPNEGQD